MSYSKRVVLKFGGSVIHSQADFERIEREILRFVADGYQVVAVVSAYYGVTEKLIVEASREGTHSSEAKFADLIASGEFQSALDLVSHLNRDNLCSTRKTPRELDFVASGRRDSALPMSINADKIKLALDQTPIVVVPGFSAVDEHGDRILLGRGGSDISAVCIAEALGLDSVRLLKDVDGLYDMDPNKFSHAKRLPYVDYNAACEIGGELIQTEAINFAASKHMHIDIAAIGEPRGSRVGPMISVPNDEYLCVNVEERNISIA